MNTRQILKLAPKKKAKKIFDEFLNQLQLENKRESTIRVYKQRLQKFERYIQNAGITDFRDVKRNDILDFQRDMLRNNLNPRTINGVISTVCVYYQWAEINGVINQSPAPAGLHMRTNPQPIDRLSDENIATFLSWVDTLQPNLRAAFWLLYSSGARVGEVANLTYSDVTLRKRRVYINISDAKWGSDRCIPIIDQHAAEIVWDYQQSCEVTGRPLFRVSRRTLQTYATHFETLSGIKFHCHLLRHTFAAKLLEQGIPITTIQFLLGHKTLNMTAHYTQSAVIDTTDITPTIYQERGTIRHE